METKKALPRALANDPGTRPEKYCRNLFELILNIVPSSIINKDTVNKGKEDVKNNVIVGNEVPTITVVLKDVNWLGILK
jgi:hypothetical protein